MVTFAELLVITCIWSSYLFINAVVESCIYKLSHSHTVTSVVRTIPHQWEKAKLPLSPHAHSLTDSHQILHTWLHPPYLPHAAFGQDCPRGYFSPYSQSYHTFLVISLWAKSFYRPTAQAVEPILTHDTPTDAYSRSLVPFGDQNTVFSYLRPSFLGTYYGKPMANTYSHNCMMHRDTMLKFGRLFDLAKYLGHTQNF